MKLRRVVFDAYVGDGAMRNFDALKYDLDLDLARLIITITPRDGGATMCRTAHGATWYPEPDVAEAPARALPGKPRSRT